jgi:protein TonB
MTKWRFQAVLTLLALVAIAAAQTDPPAKRVRVSSGVANGLRTHNVTPKYPTEAREKGIQGDVLLTATIDEKGKIVDLKVLKGDPILAKASVDAIKQWKYKPYILNGEPVEVETTIKIQFHM